MQPVVLSPSWVIPVEPRGEVLPEHSIVIIDNKIADMGPRARIAARYTGAQVIALDGQVVVPGFVNLHTHAAMNLLRGFADDLPLMRWLQERIWPAESAHVSEQFVFDGTLLACAEMLRSGVTCFNDMYFFPEAGARAALQTGMRASLGIIVIEFPSAYANTAMEYLHKGLATRDRFRGETLLSFCIAPHAPYSVSDASFRSALTYTDELGLPMHLHLHETADELERSTTEHGKSPVARLEELGALGPNLIAVHAVHLNQREIELLARTGCHIAHCPASNLKLASGIAPVAAMIDAGLNVGIGTDGVASNNRLDMMEETRLAALLAKGASGDAGALPAAEALAMATINGAKALGLDHLIGSIAPGKAADLVAIDLSDLLTAPHYDVVSHLVYVASRSNVSHVWVDGKMRVENGSLLGLDVLELVARANAWANRIQS